MDEAFGMWTYLRRLNVRLEAADCKDDTVVQDRICRMTFSCI